ncbi:MAG: hypothetical protein ACRDQ5_01135 [Sciscionella sp.]
MSRRAATLLACVVLGLLLAPGSAAAQQDPVFDPADARDLADTLAEATASQGVCYGWHVTVTDNYTGTEGGESVGSNLGPGRSLDDAGTRCDRRVEFDCQITYTSESSESNDYASYQVNSLPRGPSTEDLASLRIITSDDLVGDNVDVAVERAVTALPQLTADSGAAPQVEATPESAAPGDVGTLSDHPGSDFLRRAGGLLAFGAVLLLAGIVFGVYAWRNSRRERMAPVLPARTMELQEPPVDEWAAEQEPPRRDQPPRPPAPDPPVRVDRPMSAREPETSQEPAPEPETSRESPQEPPDGPPPEEPRRAHPPDEPS